jgi:general secretion pathway protein E
MTDEAPVIRWVNNLFFNAAKVNASDIHIEPGDKEVAVRYRIDGKLKREKAAPKSALNSIVSRVKIEAGLNIAEKRLPQDGRITKKIQGRLVDVRVSVVPTAKGERIVMRLLDKERTILDLSDLGYEGGRLELVQHLIERPNGILLVTGPTGSGKTTTLYAGLSYINSPDRNILTAEDPVEYELPGIGQMQVHPKIGLTFASGLRSFLRQDPDVIMVGEIRDHETAEIAIHASLTGHLVLSTLHTNDAAGAMTRMVEMGVQPFLIASSVLGVIAQRLVRKLCRHCRVPHPVTAEDLRSLGLDASRAHVITGSGVQPFRGMASMMESEVGDLLEETASPEHDRAPHGLAFGGGNGRISAYPDPAGGRTSSLPPPPPPVDGAELLAAFGLGPRSVVYKPAEGGCEACGGVGYKGRISIAEVLVLDEPVRRDILNQADAGTIARTATLRGMRTLREDGARLVLAGVTSLEEVLAATQAGEMED